MNRTDRLFSTREELRRVGRAGRTAEQLAQRFEVSPRTVKRDVSTLQHAGFPVWARPGPGGGYVVDSSATLPPVNFTESEVVGLAAAAAASHGQPFDRELQTVLAKVLNAMEGSARKRAALLANRVWIDVGTDGRSTRNLRRIEQGLSEQRVLELRYRDRNGTQTQRRVDPAILANTGGQWYLVVVPRDVVIV